MDSPQSKTMDDEVHTPVAESSSSEDLESLDINHSVDHTLFLQDTNYTKDTVAASEQAYSSRTERERQGIVWYEYSPQT